MDQSSTTNSNSNCRDPLNRVPLIRRSLRCFGFGLASLVPIIGLPFGIASILIFCRTSQRWAGEWNPARRYLCLGLWAGIAGVIETTTICFWISLRIAEEAGIF